MRIAPVGAWGSRNALGEGAEAAAAAAAAADQAGAQMRWGRLTPRTPLRSRRDRATGKRFELLPPRTPFQRRCSHAAAKRLEFWPPLSDNNQTSAVEVPRPRGDRCDGDNETHSLAQGGSI